MQQLKIGQFVNQIDLASLGVGVQQEAVGLRLFEAKVSNPLKLLLQALVLPRRIALELLPLGALELARRNVHVLNIDPVAVLLVQANTLA